MSISRIGWSYLIQTHNNTEPIGKYRISYWDVRQYSVPCNNCWQNERRKKANCPKYSPFELMAYNTIPSNRTQTMSLSFVLYIVHNSLVFRSFFSSYLLYFSFCIDFFSGGFCNLFSCRWRCVVAAAIFVVTIHSYVVLNSMLIVILFFVTLHFSLFPQINSINWTEFHAVIINSSVTMANAYIQAFSVTVRPIAKTIRMRIQRNARCEVGSYNIPHNKTVALLQTKRK